MATVKHRWWMRDAFHIYIKLPYLEVSNTLMQRSMYSMEYIYYAFRIRFIKWEICFSIGDSYRRLVKDVNKIDERMRKMKENS